VGVGVVRRDVPGGTEGSVVVVVPVVDSGEVVGLVAGVTVSVFCSQAASNTAPARMQMYFFISEKFG
jgi:hypothetical protein